MRPQLTLRVAGLTAVGALCAGSDVAGAQAPASSDTAPSIPMSIGDRELAFGQPLTVSGRAWPAAGGVVSLQFRARGGSVWREAARSTVTVDGRFRFRKLLSSSGAVRVVAAPGASPRAGAAAPQAPVPAGTSMPAGTSRERGVVVAARVATLSSRLDVLRGRQAMVAGTVRPAVAGRAVALERAEGGRWVGLATARTDARGGYRLTFVGDETGTAPVRVRFAGDRANSPAQRTPGRLSVYRPAMASRYDLYGGPLACGGTLGYDAMVVAHKSLPCGTKVMIRYGERTVQATVRDRGPFVGGREFDLSGAVARRLGFEGVGTIGVSP